MRFEYLIFNLLVLAGPVAARLYSGTRYPDGNKSVRAIFTMALVFWVWDYLVTGWWWDFNPKYILGWNIGRLPIEEILFFLTVPYASLLIWENIKSRWGTGRQINFVWRWVTVVALSILMVYAWINLWIYTAIVIGGLVLVMGVDYAIGLRLFERKNFLIFLLVVSGLIFVWNGYLTARPVVVYNREMKSNLNIGTIPIEDFIYGWILITGMVLAYEQNKNNQR